jgi:two-component system sensor histidine kinase HydH
MDWSFVAAVTPGRPACIDFRTSTVSFFAPSVCGPLHTRARRRDRRRRLRSCFRFVYAPPHPPRYHRQPLATHAALDLVACGGHLAVGSLVLLHPGGSPLAAPLGLLALDLFAWNFADFAFTVSGNPAWHLLDLSFSPFSPALAFFLAVKFIGGARAYRWALIASDAVFTLLAGSAWLAFVLPAAKSWIDSKAYSAVFLASQLLVMAVGLGLLYRHLRRSTEVEERYRTRTMIAALLSGALFAATDFCDDFGLPVPSLSNVGTTISALLMAVATLRLNFLGKSLSRQPAVIAAALALIGVGGYLAVFRWLRGDSSVLMVATVTVTLTMILAFRQVRKRHLARRERVEGLATIGRFSAQMAHDLKNPLAALKGAIQFLSGEVARDQPLANQREFLDLIGQQVERIQRVVDDYQRLWSLQPRPTLVDLNQTVREILALARFAADGVAIETTLEETLPLCSLDRDLVGRAVENLVRNATEAMPQGGIVRVRTASLGANGRPRGVLLSVQDGGVGMDAREAERAFDEFFTTKAQGSGLGLPFVRRVVRAHGGRVKIVSSVGAGTTVTLRLPVKVKT